MISLTDQTNYHLKIEEDTIFKFFFAASYKVTQQTILQTIKIEKYIYGPPKKSLLVKLLLGCLKIGIEAEVQNS